MHAKLPNVQVIIKRRPLKPDTIYHYHRPTKTRPRGKPGSPDYFTSYAEAERRWQSRQTNDFAWLLRKYKADPAYSQLADSTRGEYRRHAIALDLKFGTCPIQALTVRRFRVVALDYRDAIAARSKREADGRLVFCAGVFAWAVKRGLLDVNVLEKYERIYASDRSEKVWLPEQVDAFLAVAPCELKPMMQLAFQTAQRQGDLLKLAWSAYDGTALQIRQGKTKRRVVVPCTMALKDMLDGMDRKGLLILTTKTGRAWTKRYFAAQWDATAKAAGIHDLHFHDLRGTAITMLSEADATTQEIAAISGHSLRSVNSILDRYLTRTRTLADGAISKLENASRTKTVNPL